jgi:hypothetical protein
MAKRVKRRVVLARGVYIDEDGTAFSRKRDGRWLDREDMVYVPYEKLRAKKVDLIAEVLDD